MENKEKIIILTVRINELDWFLFLYFKTKLNENYIFNLVFSLNYIQIWALLILFKNKFKNI